MTRVRIVSLLVTMVVLAISAAPADARKQRVVVRPTMVTGVVTPGSGVLMYLPGQPYPHIIHNGRDVGTDPDINIRLNMLRDPAQFLGGNY